jgi:hypothetical protein
VEGQVEQEEHREDDEQEANLLEDLIVLAQKELESHIRVHV